MTLFDIMAGLTLAISGLMGFVRGATREVTTVIALVLAAMVAVFGLRITGPLARHFITTPWIANVAALLVLFVAVYVVLRLIGGVLTRSVQSTVLSGPDRVLGLAIGVVRGLVAIGAFILLINAATPPERMPPWITGARLYPVADAAGGLLRLFAPQGWKLASDAAPAMAHAVLDDTGQSANDEGPTPTQVTSDTATAGHRRSNAGDAGYTESQRKALDVLVEKSR